MVRNSPTHAGLSAFSMWVPDKTESIDTAFLFLCSCDSGRCGRGLVRRLPGDAAGVPDEEEGRG